MILLPLLLLVGLALLLAGLLFGAGPLAPNDAPRKMSRLAFGVPAAVVVAAVVAVLVAVVGLGVLGGLRSDGGTTDEDPAPVAAGTTDLPAPKPAGPPPARKTPSRLGPVVRLPAEGPVGELAPETVLQVRVRGFDPFASAVVRQCVGGEAVRCENSLGVQFAEDGTASFQYLVIDDFDQTGRCRASDPPCFVEVAAVGEDAGAAIVRVGTVFGDPVPRPGRMRVNPSADLVEGEDVHVELRGFRPGAPLDVLVCGAAGADGNAGAEQCSTALVGGAVRADARGRAETTLVIGSEPVGAGVVRCDRSHPCRLAVGSDTVVARSNRVALTFAAPPGADYDPLRLTAALAVAAGLLLLCLWLIGATDWSATGESAAPEIDDAEYADLDALVAAMPPEEDVFA